MDNRRLKFYKVLFIMVFLVCSLPGMAQTIVKGVVKDSKDGSLLPGVSITVKDAAGVGTSSGIDGTFTLKTQKKSGVLKFSFIGYVSKEVSFNDGDALNVLMDADNMRIQEVVVTALGISRDKKSLSYSAQSVKSDELNVVKDANFTASIAGKASNVTITQGSGGVGSASNIVLRGNNSLSGSGQPLIVIDGIPTVNENVRPATSQSQFGQNYLAPDALSTINPDDIENVSILKGPAAAALYGAQAANGAIVITTKSGKEGTVKVNIASNTTFSSAAYYADMQTAYGGDLKNNPTNGSWGSKTSAASNGGKEYFKDFLETGVNTSNSINVSGGNKIAQVFSSYANTYGKGIMPSNSLSRHNLDLKGSLNLFNDLVEVESKISYTQQEINNPYSPGSYLNPYYSLLIIPSNLPMDEYKNYYTPGKGYNDQNWIAEPSAGNYVDNPYWDVNKVKTKDNLNRLLTTTSVRLNVTDYLNVTARGTVDKMNQDFINKMYKGTRTDLASSTGGFVKNQNTITQYYGDIIVNFNKDIVKDVFRVSALAGSAIRDFKNTGVNMNSNRENMFVPDLFVEENMNFAKGAFARGVWDRKQIQSLFYSAEFSYKNAIFLTNTGRNDWSSTLPSNKNNYFYPSVGASVLFTELFDGLKSKTLSYLKARVSYTQVGNDLPSFIINPVSTISGGSLVPPNTIIAEGVTLKPEMTTSIEAGIDFSLFKNLVKFEGTVYKTNTKNQLFTVSASAASGAAFNYVNGGDIENKGFEFSLTVSPKFGHLEWISTINYSKNTNKVIDLVEGKDELLFSFLNNSTSYYQKIEKGGSLGDIYAKKWDRDANGNIILNPTYINGVPVTENALPKMEASAKKIGNANPDFMLSWNNSVNYNGFRVSALVDGRFGGKVISLTQAMLDSYGNSVESATDRDNGYVLINGQKNTKVQAYYQLKGGIGGPLGEYAYDATVIRLREFSLGYSFRSMLEGTSVGKYLKDVNVSLIGRNLFFFYKPAPVDSELVSNNTLGANAFLGLEMYNLPTTRNIGFGINFSF